MTDVDIQGARQEGESRYNHITGKSIWVGGDSNKKYRDNYERIFSGGRLSDIQPDEQLPGHHDDR